MDANNDNGGGDGSNEIILTFTHDGILQPPNPIGSYDFFHPPCPIFVVPNKTVALGVELQQWIYKDELDIGIVRGLDLALDLNFKLFDTPTILATAPESPIEIRIQSYQPGGINLKNGKPSWNYNSFKESSTVQKYAEYQKSMGESSGENLEPGSTIKFGTNLDLSDRVKWAIQLDELDKLPPFAQMSSKSNFLSYVGHEVLGMNTLQLYMKVPGVRTPAHQENLNFCSININIGPGNCEWFGVSQQYWTRILELCRKKKLDYLKSSWWPDLDELEINKIPYFRFIQKPGDLVWVNTGCIHWVQAKDKICNNIAYNVGPVSAGQYKAAIESYKFNQTQKCKSIVPMVRLTWNFAKSCCKTGIKCQELYNLIRKCLSESYADNSQTLRILREKNVEKRIQVPDQDFPVANSAKYCSSCEIELFNIILIKTKSNKYKELSENIICIKCASRRNGEWKDISFMEEYSEGELRKVYLNFLNTYVNPSTIYID